uniref:Uncharacterized protein n=1 Tax=Setaria italica TaxID=4555 RepID=K3ZL06_SETIT
MYVMLQPKFLHLVLRTSLQPGQMYLEWFCLNFAKSYIENFKVGSIDAIYLSINSWYQIMIIIKCPDLTNCNPFRVS